MRIVVNGEAVETAAETLQGVLEQLDLDTATVATAVNGDFVPARARPARPVSPGDAIEIVAPMQGG